MQLQVEAVTKAPRLFNGHTIWGVKCGANWYSLYQLKPPAKGETLNVTVESHKGRDGRDFLDAYPIIETPPAKAQPAASNGHIPWEDYQRMAEHAHALAASLEPDTLGKGGENEELVVRTVDRSAARAAIVNTVMIAFSNGKIALPAASDQPEGWQEEAPF